jgi:hypothetical protein
MWCRSLASFAPVGPQGQDIADAAAHGVSLDVGPFGAQPQQKIKVTDK